MTGSVASAARISRCIEPTSPTASSDVRAITVSAARSNCERSVNQLRRRVYENPLQVDRPRGARHANHLEPAVRLLVEPEPASNGIDGAEVLAGHCLADDRDARRVAAIALVDRPAVEDGNAQHLEIAWSGPDAPGADGRTGCRTLDDELHARHLHRQTTRQHGRLHARNARNAAPNLL
jgi:hypothetical protein